jgi:hypothetical protein
MYRVPGVLSPTSTTRAPAVPGVQPAGGPPPAPGDGHSTGPAEVSLELADGPERIARGRSDAVVRRLVTASLDLQAALGLMGDHPASGQICRAADELDQAIRDLRDTSVDRLAGERPHR